jgi:subtilisin family serine protease
MAAFWRWCCLLWCMPLYAAVSLTFSNFSGVVHLEPVAADLYRISGTPQQVRVAPRLLLQVTPDFDHNLLQSLSAVAAVPLFSGARSHWLAVDVASAVASEVRSQVPAAATSTAHLQDLLDRAQRLPGVLLVQPDLLPLAVGGAAHPQFDAAGNGQLPPAMQQHLRQLWQHSQGEGVRIALIDDGFALDHPELVHVMPLLQYDISSQQLDARPRSGRDHHGTRVAGVLFADHAIGRDQPQDQQGLVPEAGLIAIRQPDSWTSHTLLAFQLAALAQADVINCSWTSNLLLQPVADVVQQLTQQGRHGLGTLVVFAAGNDGLLIQPGSSEAAIDAALVVGAANTLGQRLASSNYGDSLDLLAPGLAVASTDIHGGYSTFASTSLASTLVSGLAALLLSQKPHLSLSELQQQLQQEPGVVNASPRNGLLPSQLAGISLPAEKP